MTQRVTSKCWESHLSLCSLPHATLAEGSGGTRKGEAVVPAFWEMPWETQEIISAWCSTVKVRSRLGRRFLSISH